VKWFILNVSSSGRWCYVIAFVVPNILKDHRAFVCGFVLFDPGDEGTMIFDTVGTTKPMTQDHILEELNFQQHHCENLTSCISCIT
jgi:hypothetical protein